MYRYHMALPFTFVVRKHYALAWFDKFPCLVSIISLHFLKCTLFLSDTQSISFIFRLVLWIDAVLFLQMKDYV